MAEQTNRYRFNTLLIHGGLTAGPAGATTVPIVQSSSFAHETAEELEDIFRGERSDRSIPESATPPPRRWKNDWPCWMGGSRQ